MLWYLQKETEVDRIYQAWQALPEPERVEIERTFRGIDEMAFEAGIKALIEEGRFHGENLAEELDRCEGYHHKAMWAYLRREPIFYVASLITYVDSLRGRHWVRMKCLPRKAPAVSDPARKALASSLSDYYQREQGRGHRCTVETYLRADRYHYFFAYPADYADTYIGYGEDGCFVRRPQKRAFQVVFVYDPELGALDLYAQGDRQTKASLSRIFCSVVLGEQNASGQWCDATYELNSLRSRGFPFRTDPGDGIEEVRVRSMRLSLGNNTRRIILEADPKAPAEDIYDMMDEYLSEKFLSYTAVNVTKASLQFRLAARGDEKPKTIVFDVTFPDSCTLKSLPEEERLLGEKYLKQWGIDRA